MIKLHACLSICNPFMWQCLYCVMKFEKRLQHELRVKNASSINVLCQFEFVGYCEHERHLVYPTLTRYLHFFMFFFFCWRLQHYTYYKAYHFKSTASVYTPINVWSLVIFSNASNKIIGRLVMSRVLMTPVFWFCNTSGLLDNSAGSI